MHIHKSIGHGFGINRSCYALCQNIATTGAIEGYQEAYPPAMELEEKHNAQSHHATLILQFQNTHLAGQTQENMHGLS